jgi:hypothetical protein
MLAMMAGCCGAFQEGYANYGSYANYAGFTIYASCASIMWRTGQPVEATSHTLHRRINLTKEYVQQSHLAIYRHYYKHGGYAGSYVGRICWIR